MYCTQTNVRKKSELVLWLRHTDTQLPSIGYKCNGNSWIYSAFGNKSSMANFYCCVVFFPALVIFTITLTHLKSPPNTVTSRSHWNKCCVLSNIFFRWKWTLLLFGAVWWMEYKRDIKIMHLELQFVLTSLAVLTQHYSLQHALLTKWNAWRNIFFLTICTIFIV